MFVCLKPFYYSENATNTVSFPNPQQFVVVVGSAYLYNITPNTLEYDVQTVVVHSGYNATTFENNVALFILKGAIPTNLPNAQPIQLNSKFEPNGTMCSVSGWGDIYAVSNCVC